VGGGGGEGVPNITNGKRNRRKLRTVVKVGKGDGGRGVGNVCIVFYHHDGQKVRLGEYLAT